MANGVQIANGRAIFTMYSDEQVAKLNFTSLATGSNQVGEVINVPVTSPFVYLNTSSLSDIRWAAFINEGSGSTGGSIAVRVSGSATNLTYLTHKNDASLISMQSGSLPQLIAISYVSSSYLTYKLQES